MTSSPIVPLFIPQTLQTLGEFVNRTLNLGDGDSKLAAKGDQAVPSEDF